MEKKLKYIFKFFNIFDKELDGFLANDIGISSIDDFKVDFKAVEKLSKFLNINKDFIYGSSDNLLIEKDGFYKRNKSFCEEVLNNKILNLHNSRFYIVSQKIPNKEVDEKNNDNYFYLIAEGERELFNGKKIKIFEVFNTSGCRWGYWRCRWELKKFLLCLKKNHFINKTMGVIDENINEDYLKFLKGEIKFEKILGSINIWYPEDYIEFKYENMNAKEEDELEEIIKELENIRTSNEEIKLIYKFKKYLIDVYGYNENEIKIRYKVNNFVYDLVILKNNNLISFKIVPSIKTVYRLQLKVEFAQNGNKINYLVEPYNDEWYFEEIFKPKIELKLQSRGKVSRVIENILKLLYSDGKRTIKETHQCFYDLITDKKLKLSNYEIEILNRLKNLIIPWNREKFKTYYKLIDKLDLQFENYINYKVLKFLSQLFNSADVQYPIKLIFRDFGIKTDDSSKETIYLYDENCDFKKNGIYFVPIEFLYMEKYKFERKKIFKRIKLILEFEENIIVNKNNIQYVLIYLSDNRKSCVIEKTDLDNIKKYVDYILFNKLKDFEEISKKDIYINRLDSFYNKKEFIFLDKLLRRNNAKRIINFVDKEKIAFGKGKVGYGEEKLIVKDSIKDNKIKGKIYSIEKNLYYILPKLKENYLIIASVTEYPVYALVDKKYENCVIGTSLIGIYDEKGKVIFNFFETFIGKIYLYRLINKYLQVPKINLDNFYQLLILTEISPITLDNINKKFNERFHKSLETFLSEISKLDFSELNRKKVELEENSVILKGVFNKKFDAISTFKTKILLKDLYENNDYIKNLIMKENKNKDFQRDIDNTHTNEIVNYLKKSEFTYIGDIIFGFVEEKKRALNISLYENELIIPNKNGEKENYKSFLSNLVLIDGQHRLKALLELKKLDEYINIEIIFTSKDGMAVIFYILNAKGKSFLPKDFFNLFKYEQKAFEELNKLEAYMPTIYLKMIKYVKKLKKANIKEIDIKEVFICLAIYWSKFIYKIDIKFKIDFIKLMRIFVRFYSLYIKKNEWINNSTKLCTIFKIIIYDFYNRGEDSITYFEKEIDNFLEWIKLNDMYSFLETIDDYSELYETYKKTYIPKSRKIYLSMPYHIHEDLIYFVAKDVVREVSEKIGEKIELIRTDKRKLGIHKQIENKIYEEIEESDLLIADITGNNPNVFAEVGYKMALDKANGIKEPQIIFIKNTKGYYERTYYKEKRGENIDEFRVNEHIRKNKVTKVAFNFNHIDQIEFSDVEYLKRELENMLLRYYNYYQIKKV